MGIELRQLHSLWSMNEFEILVNKTNFPHIVVICVIIKILQPRSYYIFGKLAIINVGNEPGPQRNDLVLRGESESVVWK